MRGVEEVEGVFQHASLDEPALSVIQRDRQERHEHIPVVLQGKAREDPQYLVISQGVQQDDERIAVYGIVAPEQGHKHRQPDESRRLQDRAVFKIFDDAQSQEPDRQREKYVLSAVKQFSAVH